jgi:hypothetical protein
MAWIYQQSTGKMSLNGRLATIGYSGHGLGLNNPDMQGDRGIGPIPRDMWTISAPYNSDTTGPYTMKLLAKDAQPGDDTHQPTGRGAFRIHGDNGRGDHSASHGCIILPRPIREQIWNSGVHELEVIF